MLLAVTTGSELFLITLPSNQTTTRRRPVLPPDWNDDKVFKLSDLTPVAPTSKTRKIKKSAAATETTTHESSKKKKQKKRKKQQNSCLISNVTILLFMLLLLL